MRGGTRQNRKAVDQYHMRPILLAGMVLLLAGPAHAKLSLVEGALDVDGLLWTGGAWRSEQKTGYGKTTVEFTDRKALLGATAQLTPVAALRLSVDMLELTPYDVYADFSWPSGFNLRAGQFIPPSATEAHTELRELRFISNSLVSSYWKPVPPRDVGVQFAYRTNLVSAAAAIVNGNGTDPLAQDPNGWKDVAGKLVLRPSGDSTVFLAVRAYYGKTGEEERLFWNGAFEALYEKQNLHASGAFQHTWWVRARNSFYVQAAYRFGLIEPVGRLSMAFHWDDRYELALTGGLNFKITDDRVKVLTSYDYWRKAADTGSLRRTVQRLQARLQLSF